MMKLRRILPIAILLCMIAPLRAQDLAAAARKERERQAQVKNPPRVITNSDLTSGRPVGVVSSNAPAASKSAGADHRVDRNGHDELYWSEKFVAARQRIAQLKEKQAFLESQLKEYRSNLLSRSDVYDREHLYPPLIDADSKELDKTKKELAEAQSALDDLYQQLRESGAPAEWADSTLAEKNTPPEHPTREYFVDQLKQLDDYYESLEKPYRVERFRLVKRRDPNQNESLHIDTSKLGLGADPSLPQLDQKIQELEQQHQQARADLIQQAGAAGFTIP